MMRLTLLALLVAIASGCTLGPDYQVPDMTLPEQFKTVPGWKQADSQRIEPSDWWQSYQDPVLNQLVDKLEANQDLKAAEARYRQAQTLIATSRSTLFPQVGANVGASRSGQGENNVSNSYDLSASVLWEVDLWGRVRRGLEASNAEVEASAADLAAVRLSLESTLVQSYVQLRVFDAQKRLLKQTLAAYQRALTLTQNQYNAGIVPKSDVSQAITQLKSTEAQLLELKWQRAQTENAIAVLIGQTPQSLDLGSSDTLPTLPFMPVSVPSTLLERRPDIASNERRVNAANAQIGIAQSAWFPDLQLSASGGYRGSSFSDWINLPNRFWSLGPNFALALFDAGKRRAELSRVEAQYDQTVAQYRQSVLNALREVEDGLIQANLLAEQRAVQQEALAAAREAQVLMENQYRAGLVDYNAVVVVQATALANERTALALLGQELITHAKLIAAMGGSWKSPILDAEQ